VDDEDNIAVLVYNLLPKCRVQTPTDERRTSFDTTPSSRTCWHWNRNLQRHTEYTGRVDRRNSRTSDGRSLSHSVWWPRPAEDRCLHWHAHRAFTYHYTVSNFGWFQYSSHKLFVRHIVDQLNLCHFLINKYRSMIRWTRSPINQSIDRSINQSINQRKLMEFKNVALIICSPLAYTDALRNSGLGTLLVRTWTIFRDLILEIKDENKIILRLHLLERDNASIAVETRILSHNSRCLSFHRIHHAVFKTVLNVCHSLQ